MISIPSAGSGRHRRCRTVRNRTGLPAAALVPALALCLTGCATSSGPGMSLDAPGTGMSADEALRRAVARQWGDKDVVVPEAKRFVAYEPDFGERHIIDFESGTATVELLIASGVDPASGIVMAHVRQGVRNMAVSPGSMNAVLLTQHR